MEKIIFDVENCVLGRVSSVISKELLKGSYVEVVNCEESIISGSKEGFVEKLRAKIRMGQGSSLKGPRIIRKEDRLFKRMVRGMLPWDKPKGREAYKRLKCHIGHGDLSEEELKNAKKITTAKPQKSTKLKEIVRSLR